MLYNHQSVKIKYFTGDDMAKDLGMAVLMDFYGGLLTDKRYEVLDMYYNQDMSLAEIASELEISRQGARDAIKHGERQLSELEEKLGLAARFKNIQKRISKINALLDNGGGRDEIKSILKEIEKFV
ncbi:MAG TPA: YlxM family DNA-binding protein [Candidatus Ornithomonoglobus intestinigallinarum]|uniref:UPF0122 protein IAA60_07045 n=1 Tax=Candidatus Ornithomonoglobus intestinigallinarum TaxID=2840894 RepID=A0A9D1H2Y8_9FIRM|nr:YlxM family DNA-binding protein [Candidatus Ornithomonoglobus intestinigallinarum]